MTDSSTSGRARDEYVPQDSRGESAPQDEPRITIGMMAAGALAWIECKGFKMDKAAACYRAMLAARED